MKLSDKIIKLRKQNGWSQEELAQRIDVSRQAVSKWESGVSSPDLDKIILLSKLFEVTTDYLLIDEVENHDSSGTGNNDKNVLQNNIAETPAYPIQNKVISAEVEKSTAKPLKTITADEAYEFLNQRKSASVMIAIAVMLLIFSVVALIGITGVTEILSGNPEISEAAPSVVGLIVMFVFVAAAVFLLIQCGSKSSQYSYIENEPFLLEESAEKIVNDLFEQKKGKYNNLTAIGVVMCILSPVYLFFSFISDAEVYIVLSTCLLLFTVGIAVLLIIIAGVRKESYKKLLQLGEYSPAEKKNEKRKQTEKKKDAIAGIYWVTVTAIYLTVSLITKAWDKTWIIYVPAGLIFVAVINILNITLSKDKK